MPVKSKPDAYNTVTPYFCVDGAAKLIKFLESTFNARVNHIMNRPDGLVAHAEVRIGDSIVMMGDPWGNEARPMPNSLYVYVDNVDDTHKKALRAGASSRHEPETMFYGDRMSSFVDPTGNIWSVATHVEDVSPQDMKTRFEQMFVKQNA